MPVITISPAESPHEEEVAALEKQLLEFLHDLVPPSEEPPNRIAVEEPGPQPLHERRLVERLQGLEELPVRLDDLVEEGTLSRPQGEAIIEAWKRKAAGDSDRESETAGFTSEGAPSELAALWEKWIQMTPVRREEFEALRERIDRLEKQYSQHSGD